MRLLARLGLCEHMAAIHSGGKDLFVIAVSGSMKLPTIKLGEAATFGILISSVIAAEIGLT